MARWTRTQDYCANSNGQWSPPRFPVILSSYKRQARCVSFALDLTSRLSPGLATVISILVVSGIKMA